MVVAFPSCRVFLEMGELSRDSEVWVVAVVDDPVVEVEEDVVGYRGRIVYDPSKPDGTPVKRLDVSRLAAQGWRYRIALRTGIETTYAWYLAHCRCG